MRKIVLILFLSLSLKSLSQQVLSENIKYKNEIIWYQSQFHIIPFADSKLKNLQGTWKFQDDSILFLVSLSLRDTMIKTKAPGIDDIKPLPIMGSFTGCYSFKKNDVLIENNFGAKGSSISINARDEKHINVIFRYPSQNWDFNACIDIPDSLNNPPQIMLQFSNPREKWIMPADRKPATHPILLPKEILLTKLQGELL